MLVEFDSLEGGLCYWRHLRSRHWWLRIIQRRQLSIQQTHVTLQLLQTSKCDTFTFWKNTTKCNLNRRKFSRSISLCCLCLWISVQVFPTAPVIYRCRQITPGIGIGTRYQYRSRPKVSVLKVSANCGIGLTLDFIKPTAMLSPSPSITRS